MNRVADLVDELKGSCPGMVTSLRAHHEFLILGVIRIPLDNRNHGHATRIPRHLCDEAQSR